MSIGSKKKDKDKDAKGSSDGEASANYIIGSVGVEGRSTNTTAKQEPPSTTANNKLSTRGVTSNTHIETITLPSSSSSYWTELKIVLESLPMKQEETFHVILRPLMNITNRQSNLQVR